MRQRLRNASAAERFDAFVVKRENGCWIWRDKPDVYGRIRVEKGNSKLAHRYSYERFFGEIGVGLFICHKCDIPGCVNPDHLYAGTHEDNNRDKIERGRNRSPKHRAAQERRRHTTQEIRELIRRDYKNGSTQMELAEKYRVCQSTISATIRKVHNQGVRGEHQQKRRTGNFRSKITETQRQEIRDRYATGTKTQAALALEYGVTQARVSDIITGRDKRRSKTIPLQNEALP